MAPSRTPMLQPILKTTCPLVDDVARGLAHDEFFFVLQPKLRLKENKLLGFEYLIRWRHPEGGVLGPANFISIVEDSSLAASFTDMLIARAVNTLAQWRAAGHEHLSLAINLSATELGRKDLPHRLEAMFTSLGVRPGSFEIELTDVVRPDQLDWLVDVIQAVRAIGVCVALDDLGSGFNSFTLIQQLPVDIVKFNRSLVKHVVENKELRKMVETLVRLAQDRGKRIVLTGVETAEQYAWAQTLPGIEGQGFFIGKPLDEAEIDAVFLRHASGDEKGG